MGNRDRRISRLLTVVTLLGVVVLSTCSVNQVGLGAKVDITPPTLAITTPAKGGLYFSGDFVVTGTTSDDISKDNTVALSYPRASGGTATQTVVSANGVWTFTVPSNVPSGIAEGSQTITATATDEKGKVTSLLINVIIDNKKPTVLITVPSSYGTPVYATSNYLEIKGEVFDASPVDKVEVGLVDETGGDVTLNDGSIWKTVNGTKSWNTRLVYGATNDLVLTDGKMYAYRVRATDTAGNVSTSYYHVQDFSSFLTGGALFPSTDAIGHYDQEGSVLTIGGTNVTVTSHDGTTGRTWGDFSYDTNTNKPQVTFTNLAPTPATYDQNVLGFNASIRGKVERGSSYGAPAVDPTKISINLYSIGDTTYSSPLAALQVTTKPAGDSHSFQADIKKDGSFLAKGYYRALVHAETISGDTIDQPVVFMINTQAPWVITDSTLAPSGYTGTTLGDMVNGFKVPHQDASEAELDSFTIDVPVMDQNGADKVLDLSAKAFIIDGSLNKTEIDASNSRPGTGVSVAKQAANVWRVTVPFPQDTSLLVSTSQFEINLVLTNDANLNGYLTLTYNVRGGLPVVTILSPATGSWVTGNFLTFGGTATLATTSQVRTAMTLGGSLPDAAAAKADATNWSLATNVATWSATHDMSGRPEGTYDFWAVGRDTDGTFGIPLKVELYYDRTPPSFLDTTSGVGASLVVKNTAVNFGGTVSDPNLTSVVISYQKDGGSTVEVLNDTTKAATWAWTLPAPPDHSGDGIYDITFVANDASGKSTSFNRKVQIDTTSPILTITAPVANELVADPSYTLRGLVTDNAGKGVTVLEFSRNSTNGLDGTWTNISLTGLNWAVTGVDLSKATNAGASTQGAKTLHVRATDGLNTPTVAVVSFNYDTAPPTVAETAVGVATQVYRVASFHLSGTAGDTNALSKVEVFGTKDGVSQLPTPLYSSTSGAWDYTRSVDTVTHTDDGLWVFTITATDVAGRTSSLTRTVLVDTTLPTVTIDPFGSTFYESSLPAAGTATDGTGNVSGLDKVEYSLDGTNWFAANGTDSWNKTINIGALSPVGTYVLSVRATDKAKNVSTPTTTRGFTIDRANPTISETSYTGTAYKNASFIVSLDLADDLGLATTALTSTLKVNNVTQTLPAPTQSTSGATSQNWTQSVPIAFGDGTYELTFTALDGVGRAVTIVRTVIVDTTAPILNISNLNDGDLFTSASLAVLGSTSDNGSGAKNVQYNLNNTGWVTAAGTTSWTAALSGLSDSPSYSIAFRAEDNSGNVSAVATLTFKVDLALPALAETTSIATIPDSTLVYKATAVTLGGTVTDANGITHLTLTYQKDGGSVVNALDDTDNNGSWTYTLPFDGTAAHAADGVYEVTVTATDGANRTSSLLRKIQIDTKSPDLTITAPLANELVAGSAYTIRGQVTDNGGKGIATTPAGSFAFSKDSTNGTDGTWTDITLAGLNWSVANVDFSPGGEGTKKLWVRATDGLNAATATSVDFNYDTAAPTLAETVSGLGTATVSRSVGVSLGGAVFDSNALQSVTVTVSKDGAAAVPQTQTPVQTDTKNWVWSWNLPNTEEGTFVINAFATDVSGRTSTTVTRTIVIDKTAPTLEVTSPDEGAWLSSASVTLRGTASDTGTGVRALYYAAGAAPAVPVNPMVDANWTGWTKVTGSTASWSVALSLTEGSGKTYVFRAVDQTGNVSAPYTRTFGVDTAKPTLTEGVAAGNFVVGRTYSIVNLGGTNFTLLGATTNTIGQSFVATGTGAANGTGTAALTITNGGFSLSGTSADSVGVASVSVIQTKAGGSAVPITTNGPTGTTAWSLANLPRNPASIGDQATLDATANGVYDYLITVTDVAGKTETLTRTVRFDKAAAVVTISGPLTDGSLISSSSFAFSGIASDGSDSGVAQVQYATAYTDDANDANDTWINAVGTNSWSFNIANMATTFGAEGSKTFGVRAVDNAGNISASVARQFTYDTAVPLAAITGSSNRDTKVAFSLAGTATDNYGVNSLTITQTKMKDNLFVAIGSPTTVTVSSFPAILGGTAQNRTWTLGTDVALPRDPNNIGVPLLDDGEYKYDLTATDLAGRTSLVATVTVRVDQSAPQALTIIDPAVGQTGQNALTGKTNIFKGTVGDAGVGAGKVWYAITGSPTAPTVVTTPTAAGYTALATGNGNWSFTDSNRNEGTYYLHALAEDTAGNLMPSGALAATTLTTGYTYQIASLGNSDFTTVGASSNTVGTVFTATGAATGTGTVTRSISVAFDIDVANPVLTETTIGTTVVTDKNVGFSFAGTTSDSHGIASVTVTQTKNGVGPVTISTNGPTTANAWANWSLANLPRNPASIGTQSLTEGLYVYEVTVTDLAGKTTKLTRSINIDITAPSISFADPVPSIYDANALGIGFAGYKVNGAVNLSGSVTDDKSVASLTTQIGLQTAVVQPNNYSFALPINTAAYATYGHTDNSNLVVTVEATDPAGNTAVATYTMRVNQASDNPVITFTNMDSTVNTAGGATTNLLQYNASLLATAQDDDAVDKTKVQISIDGGAYASVSGAPGTNGLLVNFNHDLSSLSEGTHYLTVKVGDTGVATTTSANVYFVIDKSPPTITVTNPATGTGVNADFSITGSASDTSGLKTWDDPGIGGVDATPYIEWSADGVDYSNKVSLSGGTFSISATLGGADGTQVYYLRATDIYGKITVQEVRVQVDRALPTISYIYPASGTSLNGKALVRGSASDNNSVTSVEYSLDGGSTWTVVTGDKYAWSFQFDTRSAGQGGTPGLTQGAFNLKVRATDASGNVSAVGTLPLVLDQTSDYPVITILNMDQTKTLVGQAGSNLQESNAQVQGSISDDDWLDASSILYRIDGGTWTAPASTGSNSTIVSFQQSLTLLADGTHSIEVMASDTNDGANARKNGLGPVTTTLTAFYFAIDKSNPVVVIDTPASTYTTGALTLTGTVTDGNQSASLLVSTDGGSTYSATGVSGFTAGAGPRTWTWTGDLSAKPEGPFTVKVKGVDQFNKESVADLTITVDHTGPTMAISAPTASVVVNGPVAMSGTAIEPYGISAVQIAIIPQGDTPISGDWVAATGSYSWTYAFDSTSKTDGNYTLWVRGSDTAGNLSATPAQRNFSISQASDAPSISLSTVSLGGTYLQNLLPGSLQMSGTATDDDSIKANSLQIRIDANDDGDFSDGGLENWAAISAQPAVDANVVTWSHTFSGLTDGKYRFELRTGDINFAGNYGDAFKAITVGPVVFSVDTALPTGVVTSPAQGAYLKDPGSGTLTLTGTAADANGIQKVEIKVGGGSAVAVTGTTSWSYDYSIAGDGQVNYQILITDNYGKVSTIDRYFTVDTTAPVVAFSQPAANSTVNGSLQIAGNTTEANQMDKVYLWIGADGATPSGSPTTGDWTGWTLLGGTYSWQQRVNTTLSANAVYDVHVRALDTAGNLSADTILQNLTYDQTTNLPVFTSLSLTGSPTTNLFGTGGTITGVVTDDDSVNASTIQISTDNGSTWANVTAQGTSGPTVNFSHNLTTAGLVQSGTPYSVKFRVSDTGDIGNGVAVATTTTAAYVVAYDTANPTVAATSVNYVDRYSAAPIALTGGALSGALVNNSFTLKTTASDASGISGVTVSLNGDTPAAATFVGGTSTWDLGFTLDLGSHTNDGTYTFSIVATDVWGKSSTTSLSLVIDTTEPTVSFLNPASLSSVNGSVTVQGTSFDGSTLSSLVAKGGDTSNVTFTNAGTIASWTWQFNASTYTSATYATETGVGSGIWTFPITVTVFDAAGNKTVASRSVNLDPNGDKPVIVNATLLPADGGSVAGAILLQSTVTDDDSPSYVRIFADLNDDGVISNNAYPKDLNSDADTLDAFETESNYQQITITNGVWSTLANTNSEFSLANMSSRGVASPTGWLRFEVVPYDLNGLAGTSVWRRIYVDATSPSLTGLNHASGDLVKGTVTFTGTISDDATLDTANHGIQVSYDGGTTWSDLSVTGPTASGGLQNYAFNLSLNTATINGNAFNNGSGVLYVVLKVTDRTYKQSQINVNFNVDNKLPTAVFDYNNSLVKSGSIYSFKGNASEGGNYQILGSATDSGAVSGIDHVNVYFVKGGNFYNPKTGATTPVTNSVSNDALFNQAGTLAVGVPFTEDSSFVIKIDNRLELGQFDATVGIGDQDGFEESLKAKSGYDEWSSFFDSKVFPDGPISVYYVAYDQAGNKSYDVASAQMANNPPSVPSVTVGAKVLNDSTTRTKAGSTVSVTINATDQEGIDTTTYKLKVLARYAVGASNVVGTKEADLTNTYYGTNTGGTNLGDFSTRLAASATVSVNLANAAYTDAKYYLFEADVNDTDGNQAARQFYVLISNNDAQVPIAAIDNFTVAAHQVASLSHIEETANSPDATDADLSGTVKITGTASDDTGVSTLTVQYSLNSGSSWTTISPAATLVDVSDPLDPVGTASYTWSIAAWDTSAIPNAALANLQLRAVAVDAKPNTGYSATKTVDVVPYITDITTGWDSGLKANIKRSALGKYTVARGGSNFTLKGYNFSSTSTVTVGGVNATAVGTPNATTWVVSNLNGLNSGAVVITTNSVSSQNNTNSNTVSNNKEANTYNPNWVDDRYIAFWDLTKYTSDTNVTEAVMAPNLSSGFDWLFVKNGNELNLKQGNASAVALTRGNALSGGTFSWVGTSGSNPALMFTFNHNSQWTSWTNGYEFTGSVQWGGMTPTMITNGLTTGQDEAYNWNLTGSGSGFAKVGLGNVSFADFGYNTQGQAQTYYPLGYSSAYKNLSLNRYGSIKMKTVGDAALARNYVAYFDSEAESRGIVFYGLPTANSNSTSVDAGAAVYSNTTLLGVNRAPVGEGWYAGVDKFFNGTGAVALAGTQKSNDTGLATPRGRTDVTGQTYLSSVALSLSGTPTTTGGTITGVQAAGIVAGDIIEFTATLDRAVIATVSTNAVTWAATYRAPAAGTVRFYRQTRNQDSKYYDLAVHVANSSTPVHYGFLAYYDETNGNLKLKYRTNLASTGPLSGPTALEWSAATVIDGSSAVSSADGSSASANAGIYVAMAVDPPSGSPDLTAGIHLAYQDTDTGLLKYAYVTFDGSGNTVTVQKRVVVDGVIASGAYNSITVRQFSYAGNSFDYRPIISTYSTAFVGSTSALRTTYPVFPVQGTGNGNFGAGASAATGQFTQKWESITVPAATPPQTANQYVYMDTAGTTITTGYNGSYLEQALFQESTSRYDKRPDQ